MSLRLSDFDLLSFDCYGTLIDWELGICAALRAWADLRGVAATDEALLAAFARAEPVCERETPGALYSDVLRRVHGELAGEFGAPADEADAMAFADSVGDWPAFPDTAQALWALSQRHMLVVISNIDHKSFERTLPKLGVTLDGLVTAEDVGAYKPDQRVFEYAARVVESMGAPKHRWLHVAQSLYHDHAPAKRFGLRTAWVDRRRGKRGSGATPAPPEGVTPDLTVTSMAELAALE